MELKLNKLMPLRLHQQNVHHRRYDDATTVTVDNAAGMEKCGSESGELFSLSHFTRSSTDTFPLSAMNFLHFHHTHHPSVPPSTALCRREKNFEISNCASSSQLRWRRESTMNFFVSKIKHRVKLWYTNIVRVQNPRHVMQFRVRFGEKTETTFFFCCMSDSSSLSSLSTAEHTMFVLCTAKKYRNSESISSY